MVPDWKSICWVCLVASVAVMPVSAQDKHPAIQRLRDVEDRVLPDGITEGPAQFTNLPDYYYDANQAAVSRFEHAKSMYQSEDRRQPFRMMTLVTGDAGIGKTFLKSEAFKRSYPKEAVFKCDITELYDRWAEQGLVENRPDLYAIDPDDTSKAVVLSRLPAIREGKALPLEQFLCSLDVSVVVIDSLDEIHPDDYGAILDQVERYVFSADRDYIHAVVLGRAIAFRDYWHRRAAFRTVDQLSIHVIAPPRFRTTGDLNVSTWNYHCYHHKLRWHADGQEPEMMPLDAFCKWATAGYPNEALGRKLSFKENPSLRRDVANQFVQWAKHERIVDSMIYNLAGNAFIRDICAEHALSNLSFDESRVMDQYLSRWMERDSKSSGRPSRSQPAYLSLYLQTLEEIAWKYAPKVDENGVFDVPFQDAVVVSHEGKQLRFPVHRVLDRSGLKHADPRDPGRRYRFEPIWLHRHFVERRLQRTASVSTVSPSQPVSVDGSAPAHSR